MLLAPNPTYVLRKHFFRYIARCTNLQSLTEDTRSPVFATTSWCWLVNTLYALQKLDMNKQKPNVIEMLRPLENMKFFLHLLSYRPQAQIEQDLRSLGAVVEPFFGKDVSYVVTDRQECIATATSQKPNSVDSSYAETSPPFSNGCPFETPCTSASPCAETKSPALMARGRSLVQRAMKSTPGPTDVLDKCRQWEIKVLYIKNFLPWLRQLKQKALIGAHGKENSTKPKLKSDTPQRLVPPFIKVEDTRCVYKPLSRSLKQWPDVTTERCQEILPKPLTLPHRGPPASTRMRGVLLAIDTVKTSSKVKVTEQKKLNCEICSCSYVCLRKHLSSETHQQFMRNPENYSALNSFISKLPYNMPDCPTGPLTEIKFQNKDYKPPVCSIDCGGSGSNTTSRVMLSVKKECTGVVVQSTFRGNLSAVKHIKVVRRATPRSTPQQSPPKVMATLRRTPQKRSLCQSEVGTDATGRGCGSGRKLHCSDSIHDEANENLVPPSHPSDTDSAEKSLLGSVLNHLPREEVILPEVPQIGDELASPAVLPGATSQQNMFQEGTSTMEYSWTDGASGFATDSGVSRRILEACKSSESDDGSFLRFLEAGAEGQSRDSQSSDLSDSGRNLDAATSVTLEDRTSSCY